jgi:hypothetical protein
MRAPADRLAATVFALALGACGSPDEPAKPIGVSDLVGEGDSLEDVLGLLALGESGYGGGGPAALAEQGAALSDRELALFSRTAEGPWREWSDELVRFEVPDDPLVVVTRVTPAQAALLRVVGSFVGTTDHRFERAYRITVGEEIPYGLVLVSKNEWFDEGICFCGPVVRKAFRCADGNLLEFSQLPDGGVKKVQAINGTHRAILFEWTHSALTREAYSRIAASLRLVEPSTRSAADWHALTRERRGIEAGFGWLRPGMDRREVIALLGEPDRTEAGRLVYVREERWDGGWGAFETRKLTFHGERLAPLEEDWLEEGELPALEGSVAWALEVAERAKKEEEKPSPEEIDRVFAEFARQGPHAKEQWNFWCRAVYELRKHGHSSETVLPLVEARFLEPDLEGHYAAHLLSNYESAQLQPLAKRRIGFLIGESASSEQRSSELSNLYGFLDDEAEALDLIRKGIDHGDAEPRRAAAWMIHRLAKPEARDAVRALLSDPDEFVRSAAASRAGRVCEAEDLFWLEQARENETEERIRKNLDQAIQSVGKGAR